MVKGKGKKGGVIQVKPIEASATAISSPQPQSPPPQDSTIVVKELEETPPPSRPPSPPPSPTSVSEIEGKEDDESEWSIEIEELSDEPQPANQPAKEKSRRDRRRSSSWSRSLMNSFRRKKRKDVKTEELYKTEPLPVDFPAKPEDETEEPEEETNENEEANETAELDEDVDIEEIIEENTTAGSIKGETVIAETSEKKTNRLSRMLSFGTFGRRKSVPQDDETKSDHLESDLKENPKINVESEQEKKRESKSKAKAKSDTKGKHDEAEGESGQFQPEVETKVDKKGKSKSEKKSKKNKKDKSQTKSQAMYETDIEADTESSPKAIANLETSSKSKPKTHQRSMFTFKTFSKSVDHVKTETDVNAGQFSEQEVTDPTSDTSNKNESQLPAGVKPKRRTIASLFKREKSVKEHETSTDSTSIQDAPALRKGSRFRSSFGRRVKAKSTDVEPIPDEGTAAAAESNKKPGRSTSMAGFGSSFSLKKMFHSTDQPPDLIEGPSTNKGILTKRGKRSSTSRPKSVQLDETPRELEAAANVSEGTELRSSRNTIGERFITFTRDSLRIKKRQRSKSVDQVVQPSEAADVEAAEIPDAVEAEDENVTTQNAEEIEVETPPSNDEEIQANPVAETVADIPPTLHDEDPEPKHAVVSSSPPTSRESHSSSDVRNNASTDQAPIEGLTESPAPSEPHKVKVFAPAKPVSDVLLTDALGEILGQLRSSSSSEGTQLREILENPHLKALLETHDAVTGTHPDPSRSEEAGEFIDLSFDPYSDIHWEMPADISAVRVVGLRKNPGEPLGLTVKTEEGQLVIARILAGGAVDRQGLLHVGDVIGEVNGVVVRSAEQLQVEIARCREHIQLKILPSPQENGSNGAQVGQSPSTILASETINSATVCCVRAHFDYDPKEDKLLPCPEIGLAFKKGDILQVVNQSDPNWWQAKKVGWSGPAGLIPSQELEERRKAFVAPEADFVHKIGFCGTRISKKKKKLMYQIKSSVDLDKAELLLYEEVTRMPPFRRKTLVLVGSEGIGRRTLKNRLINSDPDRFGTTMPHTSRPMRELEEDGMGYWFVSREEMEHDVRDHQFLEFGEHNGHLYGTKLDTIRAVIRQGKMCVLDCSPNALKIMHNSPEFMPYVIFLAAPGMDQLKSIYENSRYSSRNLGTFDRSSSIRFSSRRARTLESLTSLYEEEDFKNALEESARIQRIYEKYFDQIIINEDPDQTFRKVVEALEILSNQHQWVPVSWVY